MKTLTQFEKEIGKSLINPYFHDKHNYKKNSITFIWLVVTPSGRISKSKFQQYRIYEGEKYKTISDAIAHAKTIDPSFYWGRLPKGYRWTEILIQHDFWNNPKYNETAEIMEWDKNNDIYKKY